ncbi:DUF4440 domain-containing protein [Pseudophaeobacter sp.]|uniref:nuclear transport factor 2 family protein n=1 Tax=Pseudophaeobacter sp. TaxID=1971739 RepID=UPI00261B3B30|nr:DUF4440 domain-containing protein [Pseudophaeobacter sp.]
MTQPEPAGLSEMDKETIKELFALEESLWRSETRFDDALMDQLFADDFVEVGRSGRVNDRSEMFFGSVQPHDIGAKLPLPEFKARWISPSVALVTYRSETRDGGKTIFAIRSSIWSRSKDQWTLRFHQGTARDQ